MRFVAKNLVLMTAILWQFIAWLLTPISVLSQSMLTNASSLFSRIAVMLLWLLAFNSVTPLVSADEGLKQHFLGVASCASSNCHGSMSPRKSSPVLQNEYITWLKKDLHSSAWKALIGPAGQRIAWQLGIADASKDDSCTVCHSTVIPAGSTVGEKFRQEDGVGCESCHGAAGEWIDRHTAADATHQSNLSHDLTPLEDPNIRAATCIGCHQGDQKHPFSHRLYGAGHPRLSFELDTYSAIQPAHWQDDADYRERKRVSSPLEHWFQGQKHLALEQLERAQRMLTSSEHFPEFSSFHCFSCHHSLESQQYQTHDYRPSPGVPRINLISLEMVHIALTTTDSPLAQQLSDNLVILHTSTDKAQRISSLQNLKALIGALESTSLLSVPILKAATTFGAKNLSIDYETAEQLVMAIQAGEAVSSANRSTLLNQLFVTVASSEKFTPKEFSQLCKSYLDRLK